MVNWLFKISYTPVGPETYSSRSFMHKIPLCETLSKCVMAGLHPEVCLWSLSVEAALQFPFLANVSMRFSVTRVCSGCLWRTRNIYLTGAVFLKNLFSLTCRDVTWPKVWQEGWGSCSKILTEAGGRFIGKHTACPIAQLAHCFIHLQPVYLVLTLTPWLWVCHRVPWWNKADCWPHPLFKGGKDRYL